jgi:hypothetical protein
LPRLSGPGFASALAKARDEGRRSVVASYRREDYVVAEMIGISDRHYRYRMIYKTGHFTCYEHWTFLLAKNSDELATIQAELDIR